MFLLFTLTFSVFSYQIFRLAQVRFFLLCVLRSCYPSLSFLPMASGSQSNVVDPPPKSDMHIFTSVMTEADLEGIVAGFGVPVDLHSRLPLEGFTINNLPKDAIGLYDQHFEF